MIKPTIHCDGTNCTAVKRDANRWLMAVIKVDDFDDEELCVYHWNDKKATDPGVEHFCSESCLYAKVLGPFFAARSQS